MADIKLYQAEEYARQIEMVSRMLEVYPNQTSDREISAIASLIANLAGKIAAYLDKELIRDGD